MHAHPLWNLPVLISYILIVFYSVFDCFWVFAFKKQPAFFHSFEGFGCLSVMSYDASCVDTMTYFDGICNVFDYRIGLPARSFDSNIDRMRTALWPNVNFKLHIGFYNVFVPSCGTWILDFVHVQILQTYYYLMINMVDVSLASFSLLCSFCLLLYHCSGSILWMCGS